MRWHQIPGLIVGLGFYCSALFLLLGYEAPRGGSQAVTGFAAGGSLNTAWGRAMLVALLVFVGTLLVLPAIRSRKAKGSAKDRADY